MAIDRDVKRRVSSIVIDQWCVVRRSGELNAKIISRKSKTNCFLKSIMVTTVEGPMSLARSDGVE